MERIVEEQIFKTVDEQQILDYTWKRYWNDEGNPVVSTLTKTEKIMNDIDGTTFEVVVQDDCISQMQVWPVIDPEVKPKTKDELNIAILAREILKLKGVV